jgi:2,3-bisphosphoglycerate-dependent phosphoglycerate mutase
MIYAQNINLNTRSEIMRLYFIRHAQSENNLLWEMNRASTGRHEDPGLTPLGLEQAKLLGAYLRDARQEFPQDWEADGRVGFEITHLYTSLMRRALQTASAVSDALGLEMIGRKDLHECGGIYVENEETGSRDGLPGPTLAELKADFPALILPGGDVHTGWWNRPYEERAERFPRARGVIEAMIENHGGTDDTVAVVMHGAFHNALMTALLGLPEDHIVWISMNNAAITSIDIREDSIGINYVNRTAFLPPEMIS